MGKKDTRRSNAKYPALKGHLNPRMRYDLVDYDYTKNLPDQLVPHCNNEKGTCEVCNNPKTRMVNPLDYLNRFTEEHIHANYNHDGKRIQKKKQDELDSYNRNNANMRDIYSRIKSLGNIRGLDFLQFAGEALSPEEEILKREELLELINNSKVIKLAKKDRNVEKLVKEIRERIEERGLLLEEFHDTENKSGKGNK